MYRIIGLNREFAQNYVCEGSSIYFVKVLMGEASGIVWGDKKENPTFLFIWNDYQAGFQLMGKALPQEEYEAFYNWFISEIIPFLLEKDMDYIEYGGDHQELLEMMRNIFSNIKIQSELQKFFVYHNKRYIGNLPEGYETREINRELLEEEFENKTYLLQELENSYGSISNYLKSGYGYIAIKDKAMAAWAIMTFSVGGYDNIGVETLETYRRKGLSAYLVSQTIDKTLELKHTPIWDCCETNIASAKTALKNGFKQIGEGEICFFDINQLEKSSR